MSLMSDEELQEDYAEALEDLMSNSRPLIKTLTEIADMNRAQFKVISSCIESRLRSGPTRSLLPTFYLLDSIAKSVAGDYAIHFSKSLVAIFKASFARAPVEIRAKLKALVGTWHKTFAPHLISDIQNFLRSPPPPPRRVAMLPVASGAQQQQQQQQMHQQPQQLQQTMYPPSFQQQQQQHPLMHARPAPRVGHLFANVTPAAAIAAQQQARGTGQLNVHRLQQLHQVQQMQQVQQAMKLQQQRQQMMPSAAELQARIAKLQVDMQARIDAGEAPTSEQMAALAQLTALVQRGAGVAPMQQQQPTASTTTANRLPASGGPVPLSAVLGNDRSSAKRNAAAARLDGTLADGDEHIKRQRTAALGHHGSLVELGDDALFERQRLGTLVPDVVRTLYRHDSACRSCGLRFADEKKKQEHLDWHFRMNRRENESLKKVRSRQWFLPIYEWIDYAGYESQQIADAAPFFDADAACRDDELDDDDDDDALQDNCVPVGERGDNAECAACGEPFDTFWDDDKEDWILRDCIQQDHDLYHPKCI
jgi:pre-mRNA cleavage complex 2 protein Pcf11